MKFTHLVYLSPLLLAACVSNITPVATGGSKADGIVNMSYEYGMFAKPKVDLAATQEHATQRCIAWGYHKAEPFDGIENNCLEHNGYGMCTYTRVNIRYQCEN
ncbi:YecR family lipoprotein [Gluconobacter oxydans]|uniref:YecR family lipoprotein n=1 Tax=Gluconobacter oxydans TaxID=442 RepID=UPI0009BE805D